MRHTSLWLMFLVACGGPRTVASLQAARKGELPPTWVEAGPIFLDQCAEGIYGVGSAGGIENASLKLTIGRKRASGILCKRLNVDVHDGEDGWAGWDASRQPHGSHCSDWFGDQIGSWEAWDGTVYVLVRANLRELSGSDHGLMPSSQPVWVGSDGRAAISRASCDDARGTEMTGGTELRYFDSPQQAVEVTTELLRNRDWASLSLYYDLEGTAVSRDSLLSGSFFVRTERPEVAHPGGFWRYKEPFAPGFRYVRHEMQNDQDARVWVRIDIDQGGGWMQTGEQSFRMRRHSLGWQLLLGE